MINPFAKTRVMLPLALVISKLTGVDLEHAGTRDGETSRIWGRPVGGGLPLVTIMLGVIITLSVITYRAIEAPGGAKRRETANEAEGRRARAKANS